jgi:hypothetical protein
VDAEEHREHDLRGGGRTHHFYRDLIGR